MWYKIGSAIVHFIHWCTGWIVHPDKGGCCSKSMDDFVKDQVNDLNFDNK